MSNVVFLRLQTGEEIITQEKNGKYVKCAVLVPQQSGGLGIMPWMPYAAGTQNEEGIEIADDHITFKTKCARELENEYNKAFGSGLVMPSFSEKQEILKG